MSLKSTHVEFVDELQWREIASLLPDYNYRQVPAFGAACAQRVGATTECAVIRQDECVLGCVHVRVRGIPVLGGGVAYINGGPLVGNGDESGVRLSECLRALREEYVLRRGLTLRIAPALRRVESPDRFTDVFRDEGFEETTALQGYRTIFVDLDAPLEEIRRRLAQKWRNCLNRAERNGLVIRSGTDGRLFEEFCKLYQALRGRKGFEVELDARFYAGVQDNLELGEKFIVSIAEHEGTPVAGHVASILGDTCVYLLGATSEAGLEQKASYLLQWHALMEAKRRGCTTYDLGGIDPEGNPGVYHFKAGLGGEDRSAAGPFELPVTGVRQLVLQAGESTFRSLRRLRRFAAK